VIAATTRNVGLHFKVIVTPLGLKTGIMILR
jgi:hypothetical protein